VRISSRDAADMKDLAARIREHDSVRAVLYDPMGKTLVVRYDTRRGAARLLRGALSDRMSAARPANTTTQVLRLTVDHELEGRMRVRLGDVAPGTLERFAAFVGSIEGVQRAAASPATGSVLVLFDPKVTSSKALLDAVAGVPPSAWPAAESRAAASHVEWAKVALTTAALASALTPLAPALTLSAVAASALPPFRRAFTALREGRVNVDVMDATAITVCLVRAEPVTAAIITTLLALGDLILDRTQARARRAISQLMRFDDGDAYVLDEPYTAAGARPRRVHPRELRPGHHIVIYPGSRIPADGVIVDGSVAVDEKALTGESVLRERFVGDRVMAASVAVHGQATAVIERAGGDTVAARIVRILEGTAAKPMTLQRNAERSADRLVLPTFGIAGAAWAISGQVDRLASVLITDFGTGVRVAVPTAALTAMTLAAREGVLVKGATFLERLSEVDTIVFDKTGTLTEGVPEVVAVRPLPGGTLGAIEIAALAAGAESNQSHPIADALRRHAAAVEAPVWHPVQGTEVYRIGLGLEAKVNGRHVRVGNARMMRSAGMDTTAGETAQTELARQGASSVLLSVDGRLEAAIGYADAPRPESQDVVIRLRQGGRRRVLLLSGDARAPVEAIAERVGIDEAIAEVLPEDKAEVVRRLKAQGRKVAMVGDGINDAPALALADVGISLQGGTEVALETADVVLLEGGLRRLPTVFGLADEAMTRVRQVLGLVLVPNAAAIGAGALGLMSPVTAAVINNGSTILAAAHAVAPLLRPNRSIRRSSHDSPNK
jgi:Cu2+-exporting ATPase